MSILPGNGDGTFGSSSTVSAGNAPHSVAISDFNIDGNMDIAVAAYGSNFVSVFYGNGSLSFPIFDAFPVSSQGPHALRSEDLSGDNRPDIVTVNDQGGDASVLIGNSAGGFHPSVNYPVGLIPKGLTIADVDNDGIADIVAGITGGNYPSCCVPGEGDHVSVLLGIGDGTFGPAQEVATGRTIFSSAVADMNGDGTNDIVTADYSDSTVSVIIGVVDSNRSMLISWDPSIDTGGSGLAGYRVFRNGSGAPLAEVGAGQTSYSDGGLLPRYKLLLQNLGIRFCSTKQ